jgi:hypothetical protein
MGLCLNYNDKFTICHKYRGLQLLLLEAPVETRSFKRKEVTDEHHIKSEPETGPKPKISLHALT